MLGEFISLNFILTFLVICSTVTPSQSVFHVFKDENLFVLASGSSYPSVCGLYGVETSGQRVYCKFCKSKKNVLV